MKPFSFIRKRFPSLTQVKESIIQQRGSGLQKELLPVVFQRIKRGIQGLRRKNRACVNI